MSKKPSRLYRTPGIHFASSTQLDHFAQAVKARAIREPLDTNGIAFLAQMAGKVTLAGLAGEFPHIVNKLAPYRYEPAQMLRAIDTFLIDDRPDRQGFPFSVVIELGHLREIYNQFGRRA